MFPLFATGVVDTGGKFVTSVTKFAAGVADTSANFAANVVATPVSLIPVVHLDL